MRFAIAMYNPDYLIISNNDMICMEETLKISEIGKILKMDPLVGIVGVNILSLNGQPNSPCRKVTLLDRWILPELFFPLSRKFKKHESDDLINNALDGYVYRVRGSFMTLRADAFRQTGGFDEKLFLYAEEPVLSERVSRVGLRTYHYNGISMLHNHPMNDATLTSNEAAKIKQRFQSEMYYYQEYCNVKSWKILLAKMLFPQYYWRVKVFNNLKNIRR